MNLANCAKLTLTREASVCYRAIQTAYLGSALSVAHTAHSPSRFSNPQPLLPGPQYLYLAEDASVALFEVEALFGGVWSPGNIVPNPRVAWTILNVRVNLGSVADLSDVSQQSLLDTTVQELTGDWRGYQLRATMGGSVVAPTGSAPTQDLGAALFQVPGLEGFRTVSAQVPYRKTLVIFPQRIAHGNYVEWWNPLTGVTERLP